MKNNKLLFLTISFIIHLIIILIFSIFIEINKKPKEETKTIKLLIKKEEIIKNKPTEIYSRKNTSKKKHNNLKNTVSIGIENKYISLENNIDKNLSFSNHFDNIAEEIEINILEKINIEHEKKIYEDNLSEYINIVTSSIKKNWDIPFNFNNNIICNVSIFQNQNGTLKSYSIDEKCPPDPDIINSIKRAIELTFPIKKPKKNIDFKDIKKIDFEFKLIS